MKPQEAFGVVLKQYRTAAGLSQEELAFRCGLDRTFISMMERGVRRPTINTLFAVARGLGVPPARIVGDVDTLLTQ